MHFQNAFAQLRQLIDEVLYKSVQALKAATSISNNISIPIPSAVGSVGPTVDVTTVFTPKISGKLLVMYTMKGTSNAADNAISLTLTVGGNTYPLVVAPSANTIFTTDASFQIISSGNIIGTQITVSIAHTCSGGHTFGPDGQGTLSVVELPG